MLKQDSKAIKTVKSSEACKYFYYIFLKVEGHNLKANIELSQSLAVPHHWACVLVSMSNVIQTAGHSCVIGTG